MGQFVLQSGRFTESAFYSFYLIWNIPEIQIIFLSVSTFYAKPTKPHKTEPPAVSGRAPFILMFYMKY